MRPIIARLAVLCALASRALVAATTPVVEYRGERLTMHAEQTPLADVLAAVGRATGAEIRGTPPARDVTLDVADVPLGDGLARLLGKDSFALHYGPDGRIRAIDLLARGADTTSTTRPPRTADVPLTDPDRQHAVMSRRFDVTGRLAAALQDRNPTAADLIQAAFRQKSRNVRAAAQDRLLRAFVEDPEVEATFAATLAPIENAKLAGILRALAGDHAEEFMAKLAGRAPAPELRAKARAVLDALRAGPPPP